MTVDVAWVGFLQQVVREQTLDSLPVLGSSMAPTLQSGCQVTVCPPTAHIPLGSLVIAARRDVLIVHRLVRTLRIDGRPCYITQGDHRSRPDPVFQPEEIVAVVSSAWIDQRKIWPGRFEWLWRWRWVLRYHRYRAGRWLRHHVLRPLLPAR